MDGIKKNVSALIIDCLISQIVLSCNVCNVLKVNTHEPLNIVKNMYEVVSKLYFKNNRKYRNVGK